MKKNWTMRVAVLMVALTLITSCFVSSTYAKYVVSGGIDDTARVAKFGVIITADGNLFADTYKKTTNTPGEAGDSLSADGASIALSVISTAATAGNSDVDNVVAPGTKNDTGLTVSLAGTPEVAVRLAFTVKDYAGNTITTKVAGDAKDIFLAANTGNEAYADMTTANATDFFTVASEYHPVKYTLAFSGSYSSTGNVTNGTLGDVVAALAALSSVDYKAGTNLSTVLGTITLTWAWDFSPSDQIDKQDTLLGDLAANASLAAKTDDKTDLANNPFAALTAGDDYNLQTGIQFTVSVTQID